MRDETRATRGEYGGRAQETLGPSSLIPHPSSLPRVGVLGGGQLGRMLALAGYPLGLRFRFLEPSAEAPTGVLAEQVMGDYDDPVSLERFLPGLDLVTYEFESVPAASARFLAERVPVFPPPDALDAKQDRLSEKLLFERLGIPTAPFAAVDGKA